MQELGYPWGNRAIADDEGTREPWLAPRFDHFDDEIPRREDVGLRERPARPTTDAVLRWLATPDGGDRSRPLFLWEARLGENFVHYSPIDVRETEVPPRVAIRQPLVVDAQQV